MERIVTLHIEKLPEGVYLATSDDLQGLVAQGRTIQEAPKSPAMSPRS
jgi:predicted RNase H-like HicB family nuclease